MRLDVFLFSKGYASSRTRALNLIKLGGVSVNGKVAMKASMEISDLDEVKVEDVIQFASLGGLKLAYALKTFDVGYLGVCVDLGSSNGGFCDVLLRAGAEKVYAVDVGECALPEEMQSNERVVVMDRTNARDTGLPEGAADTVSADLSFISLTLVLPEIYRLLRDGGKGVLLVKPQFEVGKSGLTKSGIVKDAKTALKGVEKVVSEAKRLGFKVKGNVPIQKLFEDKNVEYLLYVEK